MEAPLLPTRDHHSIALAATEGNIAGTLSHLSTCIDNENLTQSLKDTALRHAAENGHTELVKVLLRAGARIATADEEYRASPRAYNTKRHVSPPTPCSPTAVHLAARNGHDEIVRVLLKHQQRLAIWPWFYRKGYWMIALHEAAAHGQFSTVKLMLDRGLKVDLKSRCGQCIAAGFVGKRECWICKTRTAIWAAVEHGQGEMVELLIRRGAKPPKKREANASDMTALHVAARRGDEEIVRQLLRRGWDPNCSGPYGNTTPLIEAAKHHHEQVFKILLENGARVGRWEGRRITEMISSNPKALDLILPHLPVEYHDMRSSDYCAGPFDAAASYGSAAVLDSLLGYAVKHGIISKVPYNGVFSKGCDRKDDEELVNVLIKHCPWNDATRESEIYALIWKKAEHGHLNAVLALVEWHYEISRDPCLLGTGLMGAIWKSQTQTVEGLIKSGAEVNAELAIVIPWVRLETVSLIPLHVAARHGRAEICKILLNSGADVSAQDGIGNTALHEAAASGSLETVRLLVENGADVQAISKDGSTPLHSAATNHNAAGVTEFLTKHGADINARDSESRVPAHVAALCKFKFFHSPHTYWKLEELGADLALVDGNGRVPAQYKEEMDEQRAREKFEHENPWWFRN
jgi:ankyrin repeat protein